LKSLLVFLIVLEIRIEWGWDRDLMTNDMILDEEEEEKKDDLSHNSILGKIGPEIMN
jgi:hypothetical protein